jgi:Flp pilus assembly pilin Flp
MAQFWSSEEGTDIVEYTLLLAFICLASAAIIMGVGRNTNALWGIANSRLAAAANAGVSSS